MPKLMFKAVRQPVGFVVFAAQPKRHFGHQQSGLNHLERFLLCTLNLPHLDEPKFERLLGDIAFKLASAGQPAHLRSVLEPSYEKVLELGQPWQLKQGLVDGFASWSLTVREGLTLKFQAANLNRTPGLLVSLQFPSATETKNCECQLQQIISQLGIYQNQFWCEDTLYEQRLVFEPTLAGFDILDRDSVAVLGPRLKFQQPQYGGGWQYLNAVITPLPGEELVVYERTGELDIPRNQGSVRHPRRAFASVGGFSLRLEPRGRFRGNDALRIVAFQDPSLPIKANPEDSLERYDDYDGDRSDLDEREDYGFD